MEERVRPIVEELSKEDIEELFATLPELNVQPQHEIPLQFPIFHASEKELEESSGLRVETDAGSTASKYIHRLVDKIVEPEMNTPLPGENHSLILFIKCDVFDFFVVSDLYHVFIRTL